MVVLVEEEIAIPGLPGGLIIQGHLFAQKGHLLWMDEILHHFERIGNSIVGIYVV